ncbi:hypothetical protein pdam_00020568 [Pocillopora damicornis]|uniref:Uncharacterized protein n=1 Tax=Pocillopora damicornis TaxID=46731 RepID=A0A3M6V3E8_POCDA|nr:hypothetical protein pdam_00020568 [Pocillopora damicornis]
MRGQLYRGNANATAFSSRPVVSALSSESDDPGSSPEVSALSSRQIDKTCYLKAIEQEGKTGDNYFRNQHGDLSVGRHWMIQPKLKGFSFNKGKVIEEVVRIGSSLDFHGERERDLYLSFLQLLRELMSTFSPLDPVKVKCLISINQYTFDIDVSHV